MNQMEGAPKPVRKKAAEAGTDYLAEAQALAPQLRTLEGQRETVVEIIEAAGIRMDESFWKRAWEHDAPFGTQAHERREAKKALTIVDPRRFGDRAAAAFSNRVFDGAKLSAAEIGYLQNYKKWLFEQVGNSGQGPDGKLPGLERRIANVLRNDFGIHDEKRSHEALTLLTKAALDGTRLTKPGVVDGTFRSVRELRKLNAWVTNIVLARHFFVRDGATPEDIRVAIAEAAEKKLAGSPEPADDAGKAERAELVATIARLKQRAERPKEKVIPRPVQQPKPRPIEVKPSPRPADVKRVPEPPRAKPEPRLTPPEPAKPKAPPLTPKPAPPRQQPRQDQQRPKDQGQGERAQKKRNRNRNKKKGAGPKN